jgi:hypothetical protein
MHQSRRSTYQLGGVSDLAVINHDEVDSHVPVTSLKGIVTRSSEPPFSESDILYVGNWIAEYVY